LQLRQGVGRLVRSSRDRGVVIVANPGSSAYRAQVYAALEGYRVEALEWEQARWRVHQSLLNMGLGRRRPTTPKPAPPVQAGLFDEH
jgi:ATP-dependent DNA helicase DinG